MAAPVSSWGSRDPFIPTLENDFGFALDDEYSVGSATITYVPDNQITWQNPYLNLAITPYIPSEEDKDLVATCQKAYDTKVSALEFTAEGFFSIGDINAVILSHASQGALCICSQVSKCFYLIIKKRTSEKNQLENAFPNVKHINPKICVYSPQQQFQIVYKKVNDHRKPFHAKFDREKEKCLAFLAELKQLKTEFEAIGGDEAYNVCLEKFQEISDKRPLGQSFFQIFLLREELKETEEFKPIRLFDKINTLKNVLTWQSGVDFDGSMESIDPSSYLGQLLEAINVLIPAAFDNQEKFEGVIRQSEALKNNTSSNDGPVIEDVTDKTEGA